MDNKIIAYNYAKAIFKTPKVNWVDTLTTIQTILTQIEKSSKIKISKINSNVLSSILNACFEKHSPSEKAFIEVLIENKRLNQIKEIKNQYITLKNTQEKIKTIIITTALETSKQEKQNLEKIAQKYIPGENSIFIFKENKELIAGFTISHNNSVLDFSLKNSLNNLHLKIQRSNTS